MDDVYHILWLVSSSHITHAKKKIRRPSPSRDPTSAYTSIATMPKSCFTCNAVASEGVTFSYCGVCQSVMYCSKVCQKKDWKEGEHKKICKYLAGGDGAMQVLSDIHMQEAAEREEQFRDTERSLDEEGKRFFKLFTQSTFEGSQAAARKMKKIGIKQSKCNRKAFLFHSLYLLLRADSEKREASMAQQSTSCAASVRRS
jgi:hypothetical protein